MKSDVSAAPRARVCVRDRVWWSDVDKAGMMYFARYIRFAEMAETEFFRSLGFTYDELHARFGIWLARVHVDIDSAIPQSSTTSLSAAPKSRRWRARRSIFVFRSSALRISGDSPTWDSSWCASKP
jgi:YbgC/YbaW family acyl-CoA thioester hydrolase